MGPITNRPPFTAKESPSVPRSAPLVLVCVHSSMRLSSDVAADRGATQALCNRVVERADERDETDRRLVPTIGVSVAGEAAKPALAFPRPNANQVGAPQFREDSIVDL